MLPYKRGQYASTFILYIFRVCYSIRTDAIYNTKLFIPQHVLSVSVYVPHWCENCDIHMYIDEIQ